MQLIRRGFSALLLLVVASCAYRVPLQMTTTASTRPVQPPTTLAAVSTPRGPQIAVQRATAPARHVQRRTVAPNPSPPPPPDPLAGYYGRYACRFARAGHVTPCCPSATSTLAQYWHGAELAIADYIVGRESGCNAAVINSVGCVGWFQLCGWRCNGSCQVGANNAAKAYQLYLGSHWHPWVLRGDPVTGNA